MSSKQLTEEQSILVENHMALAVDLASKMYSKFLIQFNSLRFELDDFVSTGYLALCEAALKFDKSKGFEFTTYAYPIINFRIRDMVYFGNSFVKIPRQTSTNKDNMKERNNLLYGAYDIYLDAPINTDAGDDSTILGTLEDDTDSYSVIDLRIIIEDKLTEEQLEVLMLHFQGYNQTEIGKIFKTSQVQARRQLIKIKDKLSYIDN